MLPDRERLIEFYDMFQSNPLQVQALDLVQFTQMSRFDPRSSEIITVYLSKYYFKLNPLDVRDLNLKSKSPQALCVVLDIVSLYYQSQLGTNWEGFKHCIQVGLPKAPFQSYYVGLYGINPKQSLKQISRNLTVFENWGFYCDDLPLRKKWQNRNKTLISKKLRLEHLKILLKTHPHLTVRDYLSSLNFSIHPRQAERDLKSYPKIKFIGNTKGRIYYLE